jgi:hypothetical protein
MNESILLVQDITYYLTTFGMDVLRSVIILFVVRDPIDTIHSLLLLPKRKPI